MLHQEYQWLSKEEKRVYAQSWQPEEELKGIICLLHGLGEHSGRYARWAGLFVQEGYGMLGSDLPGHGQTAGRKAYVENYQVLLDHVDLVLEQTGNLFPGVPRILYGHSMGGNIAINHAISRDPPVKALIASSPWLRLTFRVSGPELALGRFMNRFLPRVRLKRKGTKVQRLSHDPEHWADILSDPLNHGMVTGRYFWIIHQQGEYAMRHPDMINMPFLLMHGSDDKVTSPEASKVFAAGCGNQTRFRIWDGLYHELHWEVEYKAVAAFVINWLESI
jgi:alpha-beta hydrolase superfamily lysophospholipase